jgi:hypothetical protein
MWTGQHAGSSRETDVSAFLQALVAEVSANDDPIARWSAARAAAIRRTRQHATTNA